MRILLPIDGSECSERTLLWAAETFDRQNTEYYLLFVIPVLPDLNTVEYDIMDATAMLKSAKSRMARLGCHVARAEYLLGDVVDQICRYAQEIHADQIVIGTHGRSGLAKLLLGSVSIRVLERCPCNVTVYRNVERQAAQPERVMQGKSVL
jgi:nucleotide-binding universal stress UspA family protein